MDSTQQIIAKLAEVAGCEYLMMQKALSALSTEELLGLSQIAIARAKNKLKGN